MKAYRKDGSLFIEIPEEHLIKGVSEVDDYSLMVTDSEKWLNFVAANILEIGDDGDFDSCSVFTSLLDSLVMEAAELGEGVGLADDVEE